MAIQVSPSVIVTEKDLTNIIPAVSSSIGATIIDAAWGPVMDVTSIDSENVLVQRFGKPNNSNFKNWLNLANFLSYSANALVVRTDSAGQLNAVATLTGRVSSVTIDDEGTGYIPSETTVTFSDPVEGITATGVAVLSGDTITGVTITNPGSGYTVAPTVTITSSGAGASASGTAVVSQGGVKVNNAEAYEMTYQNGEGVVGEFAAKYPGSLGNSIKVSMVDAASFDTWDYKAVFGIKPGSTAWATEKGASGDEMHIVVVDADGKWSGTAGTVLESFAFVSKASEAKKTDGATAYYKTVLNNSSSYVYWMDHPTVGTNWGTPAENGKTFDSIGASAITRTLVGGVDDYASSPGAKRNAFLMFSNSEQFDVSLIMVGDADREIARFVIDNIVETRKDCVAFVSPRDTTTGDPIISKNSDAVEKIIKFKNGDTGALSSLPSSSYVVFDSGFKYQYDRYNDAFRWVPLNGDVAGLCARTDYTDDPWFSPAGFNRGQIKNAIKLGYSPTKADRDALYINGVNPVVSFPGQGIVLFGDKTGLAKPSAFDRINVRRLFITLEKAIATAAKYQLFEFNDGFTRAQFRNMVEPFLRDVKGRRGITDFKVQCDENNNTPEVIDGNRFVADIYIKPARSINFIQLNFIATRTGASFDEIIGQS